MGRKYGLLAGGLLIAMGIIRLGRLLEVGPGVPPWQAILIASVLLGALVRWLLSETRLPPGVSGVISGIAGLFVFLRVAVPATLVFGVVPTSETLPALATEMESALRLAQSGIPPVLPTQGLIGVLAILMWFIGALYVVGGLANRLSLMILPAGIFYLQMAVFDRQPAGLSWWLCAAGAAVLSCVAVALNRKVPLGRVRDTSGRTVEAHSIKVTARVATAVALVSLLATANFSPAVSEYGSLPYRGQNPFGGPGGSGVTFDRFVDLRQRLQSRQNVVVFRAVLGPEAPFGGNVYWKMENLDRFDGVGWSRAPGEIRSYSRGEIGDPQHQYFGATTEFLQRIYIDRLSGQVAPVAGRPIGIQEVDDPDAVNPTSFSFTRDAALLLSRGLSPGLTYQVAATYPRQDIDLGVLATGPDGLLSPIFANAAAEGRFLASPRTVTPPRPPNDLERYLELPDDLPPGLTSLANQRTAGATTDYEKAWMLQYWFRDSGDFTYDLNVTTGSQALSLLDWMTNSRSINYRTGYCEQFAASMAVLARLVGIPSRVVWGFAPGQVVNLDGVDVIEVRDTQAHAWVELWMDSVGWVTFDPTPRGGGILPPSQTGSFDPSEFIPPPSTGTGPEIGPDGIEPGEFEGDPSAPIGGTPPETPRAFPDLRPWIPAILGVLIAATLVFAVPTLKRARRKRRIERMVNGDITAAWDEILDRLADLGRHPDETLTPLEFAGVTSPNLYPLARGYSAAIYGGKQWSGGSEELISAEWWLEEAFDYKQKLRGSMNPRSLITRR